MGLLAFAEILRSPNLENFAKETCINTFMTEAFIM